MSNKREPLLSDDECHTFAMESIGVVDAAEMVRDHYENLITEGKLLVVAAWGLSPPVIVEDALTKLNA